MEKNYYDILGVKKDASKDDIRRTFKKLSVKYHPDKHINDSEEDKKKAEEKFKEINEAYETLSDDNKRQQYDNPIPEGFGEFEDFDPFIFGNFFNSFKGYTTTCFNNCSSRNEIYCCFHLIQRHIIKHDYISTCGKLFAHNGTDYEAAYSHGGSYISEGIKLFIRRHNIRRK